MSWTGQIPVPPTSVDVVATAAVTRTGTYLVNGSVTINVAAGQTAGCYTAPSSTPVGQAFDDVYEYAQNTATSGVLLTISVTDAIQVNQGDAIVVRCYNPNSGSAGSVVTAAVTALLGGTLNGVSNGAPVRASTTASSLGALPPRNP